MKLADIVAPRAAKLLREQSEDNDCDAPQKIDDSVDVRQQLAMAQWREAKRRVRRSQQTVYPMR